MRIATFNLWHGLTASHAVYFRPLETRARRIHREDEQVKVIRKSHLDLAFLQELNPAQKRMKELTKTLAMRGFFQSDLAGIKAFGVGIPWNLDDGVGCLVQPELNPHELGGLKLSGSRWSHESHWLGWQLSESRYALMIECMHPQWGRVLAVSAHLHHGLEWTSVLETQFHGLVSEGVLTSAAAAELRERIEASDHRRELELTTLLEHIDEIRSRYAVIILGGDLNFTMPSLCYGLVQKHGFKDLWIEAGHSDSDGFTFDAEKNKANHVLTGQGILPLDFADLTFVPKTRTLLEGILKDHEGRRRRIDYLFLWTVDGQIEISDCRLAGLPLNEELAPSDHFMVVADLQWRR